MIILAAKNFALEAHRSTNHFYDAYLPYEFHLRMVAERHHAILPQLAISEQVIAACWLHDTIENCRKNYNDIKQVANEQVAEIVRAVTNYSRGRNRSERMPAECYNDIRETPYAVFVKLCDRIANVQYSKMTGSSMFEKYKQEQSDFQRYLRTDLYMPMWDELNGLFFNSGASGTITIFEQKGVGQTAEKVPDSNYAHPNVTRVEIIDHSNEHMSKNQGARAYVNYKAKEVELSYQDSGKTLKVFLK